MVGIDLNVIPNRSGKASCLDRDAELSRRVGRTDRTSGIGKRRHGFFSMRSETFRWIAGEAVGISRFTPGSPPGDSKPVALNVRLIAATNRPLLEAVSRGEFRSDLYYRLEEAPLHLRPLRERRETYSR